MSDPTTVYLAEPIDQAQLRKGGPTTAWGRLLTVTAAVLHNLGEAGYNVYRPRAAWRAPRLDPRIEEVNRTALCGADVIVAILPAGVPTIGVPAEITTATLLGLPAVVLHDGNSQALAGNKLVTVVDHPSSIPDAVAHAARTHPRTTDSIRLVIHSNSTPPSRAYDDDAGVDLTTTVGVTIPPGGYADVQTQVAETELPGGYWGLITGRSSTLRRRGLLVPNGVIDPGWRGPLFVGAYNLSNEPVTVAAGDRIGQLILVPLNPAPIAAVTAVSVHARGLNGFGSSGA